MMETGELRNFAARYTEAWCSQDADRVARFFALDGSLTINNGEPAIGREAIAAAARSFMTDFPDLRVTMDDLRAAADRTEYRWTLEGTSNGPNGTGRRVRISGVEKWRMSPDGLIQESDGSFDAAEFRRQLDQTD